MQEKTCPCWRFLILSLSCKNNIVKETWPLPTFIRVIVRFVRHVRDEVLLNKQSHGSPHSVSFKEWRNLISWPCSKPFLPDTSLIQYCLRPLSCNGGRKKANTVTCEKLSRTLQTVCKHLSNVGSYKYLLKILVSSYCLVVRKYLFFFCQSEHKF